MTDPARLAARRALGSGMAALVAVMGVGRFVYTPILPEMLAEGALSLPVAGWIAAANFAGYLGGALAASRVRSRAWQVAWARAGLAASILALAAMALADGVGAWMAVRCVAGAASAFALVFVSAIVIERLAEAGRADRTIWLYGGVGIGIAASALTVLATVAAGGAWRTLWAASALLATPFAVLAWRAVGEGGSREASEPVAVSTLASAPPSPPSPPSTPAPRAYRAAVLAYGLFGLGYVIHATYLPAMVRAAGYAASSASWVWVLVGVSTLPAIAAWRVVARRYGQRAAIVGCYALEGTTALLPMGWPDSIAVAAIAGVGLGATMAPVSGLALPFARALDAGGGARTIGVMTASFGAGQIAGPVIAAYLAERTGFGGPSALACAALLAAAAIMVPRRDAGR
jgi:MFS family permease